MWARVSAKKFPGRGQRKRRPKNSKKDLRGGGSNEIKTEKYHVWARLPAPAADAHVCGEL